MFCDYSVNLIIDVMCIGEKQYWRIYNGSAHSRGYTSEHWSNNATLDC